MNTIAHLSILFWTSHEVGLQSGVTELGDMLWKAFSLNTFFFFFGGMYLKNRWNINKLASICSNLNRMLPAKGAQKEVM